MTITKIKGKLSEALNLCKFFGKKKKVHPTEIFHNN